MNNKKFIFNNFFMGNWKAGRMILEVRSIGHKWVYVKPKGRKQFSRITRAEWNQISSSKSFEEIVS
tara:strand:- start:1490 stop:1687 length:198 start_codon:yes stop_codon:yes gene_type:complete